MILFAHRGDTTENMENTRAAFDVAFKRGYRAAETDLVRLRDDTVVLFHDKTLKRLLNKSKTVSKVDYMEFKTLFPELFSFHEFVQHYEGSPWLFNLEIKDDPTTLDLIHAELPRLSQVVISSFNLDVVERAIDLGLEAAYLMSSFMGFKSYRAKLRSRRIHLPGKLILQSREAESHFGDLDVYCYTINDLEEAKALADYPFIKGLFTDNPELLNLFSQE